MSILFNKEEISIQGRSGKGVGAIKLGAGDKVIYAVQPKEEGYVAVFSNNGFAKKTPLSEYEVQGRNGKGLKTFSGQKALPTEQSFPPLIILLIKSVFI